MIRHGFKFFRSRKAREFFGISIRPKVAFDGNNASQQPARDERDDRDGFG